MRCLLFFLVMGISMFGAPLPEALRSSVTFHASFDKGLDADSARGERQIYSAPDYKQQSSAKPGIGDVDVSIEKGAGLAGGAALRFDRRTYVPCSSAESVM